MGSITGAICFAPLSIVLPGYLWIYDHGEYRTGTIDQRTLYWSHWVLMLIGMFMCIGGVYGIADQIHVAYAGGSGYGNSRCSPVPIIIYILTY